MNALLVSGERLRPGVLALAALLSLAASDTVADDPDCSGSERWPASMAYVHLKNAAIVTPETMDLTKTKSTRIASEKIGDDLYRQVYEIRFTQRSGGTFDVITVSDASSQECSVSPVRVFVVAQHLGG